MAKHKRVFLMYIHQIMPFVTLPIIYDNDLLFYPQGKLVAINTQSPVVGYRSLPDSQVIHGATTPLNYVNYLGIRSPQFDMIYVNMTIEAYNELIAAAAASGTDAKTLTVTIGTDSPAGTTITSTDLYHATILGIFQNGISLDIRTVAYTEDDTTKEGTLTFLSALVDGEVVSVLYHLN